jgi:hypothetical protein
MKQDVFVYFLTQQRTKQDVFVYFLINQDVLPTLIKLIFPKYICSLKEIGQAMITLSFNGYSKQVLEVEDIILLGNND